MRFFPQTSSTSNSSSGSKLNLKDANRGFVYHELWFEKTVQSGLIFNKIRIYAKFLPWF